MGWLWLVISDSKPSRCDSREQLRESVSAHCSVLFNRCQMHSFIGSGEQSPTSRHDGDNLPRKSGRHPMPMSPTLLSYRPARLLFGLLIILICGQLSRAAAVAVENARARPPLPAVKRAKYDYVKAIHMIPLYFWAQRSGRLPYERLAWRSHSCSDCLGPNGEDLSGGWYEAANTMKFGHPFWHTFMQLGWITWAYEAELKKIGELDELRMWVRVGAEYTFKAHSAPDRLVAIHGIAEGS